MEYGWDEDVLPLLDILEPHVVLGDEVVNREWLLPLAAALRRAIPEPVVWDPSTGDDNFVDPEDPCYGATVVAMSDIVREIQQSTMQLTERQVKKAIEMACSQEYAALPARQQWICPLCSVVEDNEECFGFVVAKYRAA